MKKKVFLFLQDGVGGAERMTVLIGKSLDRRFYDVTFVTVPNGKVVSKIASFIPNNYSIIKLEKKNPLILMIKILFLLKKKKPDIVFSSTFFLSSKILPFKKIFKKIHFIIRCENYLFTFSRKQKLLIKCTYPLADSIIAQTSEMELEMRSFLKSRFNIIKTLENPIDTQMISEKLVEASNPFLGEKNKIIVASGRFSFQKGFDLLIRAFAKLYEKEKNIKLVIIGSKEGPHENYYNQVWNLIEKYQLTNNVQCLGFQQNPYLFMRYADCFVLSSRWEGLPNVLIESLYLGTPVAAFKCIPIIERIVKDGINGYLAEKEDVESLSEAIRMSMLLGRIKSDYYGSKLSDFTELFK